GTDNDYSVTQNDTNTQFNVCTNLINRSDSTVDIQNSCPQGLFLLPTYLYSFKAAVPNFVPPEKVPEPSAIIGFIGIGLGGLSFKRRR
ncbi:MAG: PEP-CTERM sorting domain-containing protein, partial [Microcystaceae cyanobacterium]